MNNLPVTVVGNLTGDPELRFTPSGAAVANFTVAHTPRKYNKQSQQWEDGETTFLNGTVWREQAENVAESFKRGDRVVVVGSLVSRSYETRQGDKRTVLELEVDEVAASVLRATVKVTKAQRATGQQGGWGEPAKEGTVHTPPAGGWGSQR